MKDGIKKNITYNSVYRIVIMLTPLLTSPYLTRTLGAENLGVFTFHRAISSYFVLFALLGVSDYGTRTIAKNRGDETEISSSFWQIYYLQFMMTTVALCVYLFTIFSSSNKIVSFIFMFQVFSCYFDISWLAFGLEEFRFTSIRSIIVQVCFVVSLFVFVRNDGDLLKYAVITILVDIVSLIVLWTIVFRRLQWQKPDWNLIKKHIRPNLVLFLPVVASTIFQQMDKIMIGFWYEKTEVAYYQNAENIANLPSFLTMAVVSVMLPVTANLVKNNRKDEATALLYKSIKYTSILNIAMMFGLMSIAKTFVPWFLGAGYERSAELLIYLSALVFICGFSNVIRHQYLVPNEMDKYYVNSILVGAATNIIANFIMIPRYGADGAVVATIGSYIVVMIMQSVYSKKEISYKQILFQMIPFWINGVIMAIIVHTVDVNLKSHALVKVILEVFSGAFVYGLLTVIVLFIQKDKLIFWICKKFKKRISC